MDAMLAAYDPFSKFSAISSKHRKRIIDYFGFEGDQKFVADSVGKKIVISNAAIHEDFGKFGITNDARTISAFLYSSGIEEPWNIEQEEEDGPSSEVKRPHAETGSETGDVALLYVDSQLRDFLIENSDKTGLGRNYDMIEADGELESQKYRTGICVIDISLYDRETEQLVVIELNKNQTSDDTVGQLTRYVGWLEEHKRNGKPVRCPESHGTRSGKA